MAAQERVIHTASERERREAIRTGFEKLSSIVPDSKTQAASEAVVLANAVCHIYDRQAREE